MTASGTSGRGWSVVISLLVSAAVLCPLTGCEDSQKAAEPGETIVAQTQLSDIYRSTVLGGSSSLDVLGEMKKRTDEILSQSDSVVASMGRDKEGFKSWFTIVAFDEHRMTAARKYFFLVDETVKKMWGQSKQGMVFESEAILTAALAEKARQGGGATAEILEAMSAAFDADHGQLGTDLASADPDSRRLSICAMMVKQLLKDIRAQMGTSEVLAARLASEDGLTFRPPNFDKGVARLVVTGAKAKLQVDVGAPAEKY